MLDQSIQIVSVTVQNSNSLRPRPCHVDAVEMTAFWMNINQCGFIHLLHPFCSIYLFFCRFLIHQRRLCLNHQCLYNQQHRLLLMNGKINAMHFVIISFAVSRCLSPCFIFSPSLCFTPFPSLPLFTPPCPLQPLFTSPWKSTLPIFMHSSCFHEPSSPLPTHPSHLSIFSNPPPPPLSTLMRSRMTMNTPIIMRKQQTFPLPLRTPLPNLGPPINR